MIKIRNAKDFFASLMFLAFGGAGLGLAQAYPFGSAARMGPGYFPILISGLLAILGAFIVLRGLAADGQKRGGFRGRPLGLILAGIGSFGFGLQHFGLVLAIFTLVLLSSLGGPEGRMREAVILAALLAAGSVAVFVDVLGLPIPVWPNSY